MIKVNIVAVGRIKEKYYIDAVNEYAKMLSRFCELNIIEVEEYNFKKFDASLVSQIKEKEGERILPYLKGFVVGLSPEGKHFSSVEFAQKIQQQNSYGSGVFTFVIGGSYVIADDIKEKCNLIMSFSKMTFPHTLFRVMLTEQLYRAFSINAGGAYNK